MSNIISQTKLKKYFTITVPSILIFLFFGTVSTYAQIGNYTVSEIPNPLGYGTTISRVVANITDFILSFGIAASVIVFLVGGFQYLFSFGSEQKVSQARKTMTYGAIGAAILLLGKGITTLIVNIIG